MDDASLADDLLSLLDQGVGVLDLGPARFNLDTGASNFREDMHAAMDAVEGDMKPLTEHDHGEMAHKLCTWTDRSGQRRHGRQNGSPSSRGREPTTEVKRQLTENAGKDSSGRLSHVVSVTGCRLNNTFIVVHTHAHTLPLTQLHTLYKPRNVHNRLITMTGTDGIPANKQTYSFLPPR
jgi:hypothetical protein